MKAKLRYDSDFNCIVKTTASGIEQSIMSIDELNMFEFKKLIERIIMSKQIELQKMKEEHLKLVQKSEQVLINFALEHNLDLYIEDDFQGKRLVTQGLYDEWTSSSIECGDTPYGVGHNHRKVGEWISSSELCW